MQGVPGYQRADLGSIAVAVFVIGIGAADVVNQGVARVVPCRRSAEQRCVEFDIGGGEVV